MDSIYDKFAHDEANSSFHAIISRFPPFSSDIEGLTTSAPTKLCGIHPLPGTTRSFMRKKALSRHQHLKAPLHGLQRNLPLHV